MSKPKKIRGPVHKHDCADCKYLATMQFTERVDDEPVITQTVDVYRCKTHNLVARYGKGEDNLISAPDVAVRSVPEGSHPPYDLLRPFSEEPKPKPKPKRKRKTAEGGAP
jgi:hypothetical protein